MSFATPLITVTAPGRCGLLGNPTDMYGGAVISCTTRERAKCELFEADALTLRVGNETRTLLTNEDLRLSADPFDLMKAVLKGLSIKPEEARFALSMSSEIPMQAGLAGSTALVAAVYGAVITHLGTLPQPHFLAEAIREIEYNELGVICGFQDQHMTVFGGLNYMEFVGKGSHLPANAQPLATVEPLASYVPGPLPLLLAHTGVKHHSGSAHKPVRQRWLDGDPTVRSAYDCLQRLTRESKRLLLLGDWEAFAVAMNENQRIQFELGASGEACDRLIDVALKNGAIAAKLAGAGQGGTILALTFDPERTTAALIEAGAGRILTPVPSPGIEIIDRGS